MKCPVHELAHMMHQSGINQNAIHRARMPAAVQILPCGPRGDANTTIQAYNALTLDDSCYSPGH